MTKFSFFKKTFGKNEQEKRKFRISIVIMLVTLLILLPIIAMNLSYINNNAFNTNLSLTSSTTTSVTIIKYDAYDNVINTTTVDYQWMESNLPIYGDGVTHYYFQGPTFDNTNFDTVWNPTEDVNVESRDYGAVKGTDVKDLCELVGGASDGCTIKIKAEDNFNKWFDYEDIYFPEDNQGKLVICWYNLDKGGYVPTYSDGMRLIFFADNSTNPWGWHSFGLWDMHETLPESRYHYYYGGMNSFWPSSSGLSVKYVSTIEIHEANLISCDEYGNSKDNFAPGDTVYVKGLGLAAETEYDIWIQPEPISNNRLEIIDGVSQIRITYSYDTNMDPSVTQEKITTDVNGDFAPQAIWTIDSNTQTPCKYDIAADSYNQGTLGVYDTKYDFLDEPGWEGFIVDTPPDTELPELSGYITNPISPTIYNPGTSYQFNVTITDNVEIDTVIFELDGINYTVSTKFGDIYYHTLSDLPSGSYQYRWYAKDTSDNWAVGDYQNYIINKAIPTLKLFLNGTEGNLNCSIGQTINSTAWINLEGESLMIYNNSNILAFGVSPLTSYNIFQWSGDFNITATFVGNQNYSSTSVSYNLNVIKLDPTAAMNQIINDLEELKNSLPDSINSCLRSILDDQLSIAISEMLFSRDAYINSNEACSLILNKLTKAQLAISNGIVELSDWIGCIDDEFAEYFIRTTHNIRNQITIVMGDIVGTPLAEDLAKIEIEILTLADDIYNSLSLIKAFTIDLNLWQASAKIDQILINLEGEYYDIAENLIQSAIDDLKQVKTIINIWDLLGGISDEVALSINSQLDVLIQSMNSLEIL